MKRPMSMLHKLTFSLREPNVIRHEVWHGVVHLIDELQDIVYEEDSVIIAKNQPLVVVRADCEVAQERSSSSPAWQLYALSLCGEACVTQ